MPRTRSATFDKRTVVAESRSRAAALFSDASAGRANYALHPLRKFPPRVRAPMTPHARRADAPLTRRWNMQSAYSYSPGSPVFPYVLPLQRWLLQDQRSWSQKTSQGACFALVFGGRKGG